MFILQRASTFFKRYIDQKPDIHNVKEWYKHHKTSVFVLIIFAFILINSLRQYSSDGQNYPNFLINESVVSDVLLLYVYADTHSHAYGNLKYFIEKAVREEDGVDYYFILQQVENKTINEKEMPLIPQKNARYVQHENKCFDFGTYGWFINQFTYGNPWSNTKSNKKQKINLKRYKYFILMNSSIRGPFFTPYFKQLALESKKNYYWYSIFTRRIDKNIKLVGCTISCETSPHVQTYLLTTDFIGLSILLKPSATSTQGIFDCYPTKDDVIKYTELPISNRILQSGYLIDSLLTKYQKVNFSEVHNQFCNANKNPLKDKSLDGTSLEPYEVAFVKYNDLEIFKDAKDRAKLYQRWMEDTTKINRTIW